MAAALDAARLAARSGSEVTLACLESYQEMPVTRSEQGREEFGEALKEGIRYLPQRGIRSFHGSGHVSSVKLVGVERTYDETGRFNPRFNEQIEETVEADLVILAIGQQADLSFLKPDDGIEVTPQGTIRIDPATMVTTAPWVFAGGDVAFGPRNLIDAEADGKRAAQSIHSFLREADQVAEPSFRLTFSKIPTNRYLREQGYDHAPRQAPPTTDLGRRTGISEVEENFSETEAITQAERCLACHIQTIYNAELCVSCNRCVDICPEHCLKLVPIEQVDLPAMAWPVTDGLIDPQGTAGQSVMLKDDELCIRCGLCAVRCPVDAMTMEVLYYEQK
jgi:ferredoxin